MSPLKSLYFFAPICLVLNLFLLFPLEGLEPLRRLPDLGLPLVLVNASLTFGLNLSAVMLIGLSSMVLSLSKVVKDVLMVVAPALLLGESVRRIFPALSAVFRPLTCFLNAAVDLDANRRIRYRNSESSRLFFAVQRKT